MALTRREESCIVDENLQELGVLTTNKKFLRRILGIV
jgi:hypothetical protein